MQRKSSDRRKRRRSSSEQLFRTWVELRDLRDGSTRQLQLRVETSVHLRSLAGGPQQPDQQLLILEDGAHTIKASQSDDLFAQLRERYPDGLYERYLHQERDVAAEQSRSAALDSLVEIYAIAGFDEYLKNQVPRAP
ncbi:hypothetical protein GCM10011487_22650 [Steroidobacter agaridevorans]|uniref:Uncharacterized protein n=1 Tax=Steroidobacter agaridevorans TaxID=2695856 RepID=A0A829YAY5_9GAMM|nr:hypothetical protein [Steroidobacter agaridevorans]GFE80265.1 hypothetical protein GCM10011487_22650 [Steroidobacter agaridevorans]